MRQQRIPLLTTEEFRRFPDQTVEILNRLIADVNQYQADRAEITNAILSLRKQVKNITPAPPPSPTPTGEWVQALAFDVTRMGTTPGRCLENTRLGFGISSGTFASAREDMESQIANGTLHAELPPADIAVPIYYNNSMAAGHVAVSDHGIIYSDGVMYGSIDSVTSGYRGWGELCDGVRVVTPVQ